MGWQTALESLTLWTNFPPSDRALNAALDQFERDFVAHFTVQGLRLDQLRWRFPDLPDTHRSQLQNLFLDQIDKSDVVKEAFRGAPISFEDAFKQLQGSTSTLFEFR